MTTLLFHLQKFNRTQYPNVLQAGPIAYFQID